MTHAKKRKSQLHLYHESFAFVYPWCLIAYWPIMTIIESPFYLSECMNKRKSASNNMASKSIKSGSML